MRLALKTLLSRVELMKGFVYESSRVARPVRRAEGAYRPRPRSRSGYAHMKADRAAARSASSRRQDMTL